MASNKKSKLPNQPTRLFKDKQEIVNPEMPSLAETVSKPLDVEEYKPAESANKYPHIKKSEHLYKIIACRGDYVKLQEEVTQYLNDGWQLTGGISIAIQSDSYSSSTLFTQAVFKTQ